MSSLTPVSTGWDRLVDRRSDARGDARRNALLEALDALLIDQTLDEINIADISQRAGVTRSAFYFYFESKAMAVMALVADLYDAAAAANELLLDVTRDPETRIGAALEMLFDSVDAHPERHRALLSARFSSAQVREMWDDGLAAFSEVIAGLIRTERERGAATDGPPAGAMATTLLDINNQALERHALGRGPARDDCVATLTFMWMHSIYGPGPELSTERSTR
jgi:AcrR family transcriptional regulator